MKFVEYFSYTKMYLKNMEDADIKINTFKKKWGTKTQELDCKQSVYDICVKYDMQLSK